MSQPKPIKLYVPFIILTAVTLGVALIGFGIFRRYPVILAGNGTLSGLYLVAIAAGAGALFSPCSFPLLVTLWARDVDGGGNRMLWRQVGAFTVGVTLFLLLLGGVVALGAGAFVSKLNFVSPAGRLLRFVVGLALIAFGFWQLRGRSLNAFWLNRALTPFWERQFRWRRERSLLSHALYGFVYILAGFG